MSHPFKPYEVRALEILLAPEYDREQLTQLLVNASGGKVEYTNYGFYISIENASIGDSRRVYSGSIGLNGILGDERAGFIAFLEHCKLTLEIHPWGKALSATFRDREVRLEDDGVTIYQNNGID